MSILVYLLCMKQLFVTTKYYPILSVSKFQQITPLFQIDLVKTFLVLFLGLEQDSQRKTVLDEKKSPELDFYIFLVLYYMVENKNRK